MFNQIIKLTNAKRTGSGYIGHCPAHPDKNPSLSIKQDNDTILLYCHSGCSYQDIINEFNEHGITLYKKSYESYEGSKSELGFYSIWKKGRKLTKDSPAYKYLEKRGIKNLLHKSKFNIKQLSNYQGHSCILYPIINFESNELIGVQIIYLNNDGNKADIDIKKRIIGKYKAIGGCIAINKNRDDKIVITEGFENALAISQEINHQVYATLSATNLCLKIPKNTNDRKIHIYVDKDKSFTGERESLKAKKYYEELGYEVILHYPKEKISKNTKSLDYNDLLLTGTKIESESDTSKYFQQLKIKHSKPSKLPKVLSLKKEMLPDVLWSYIEDVSYRMSVRPDMVAIPLITAIGSVIGRKYCVQPKRNDNEWKFPPNLWACNVNTSGSKKSATLKSATRFLEERQKSKRLSYQKDKTINETKKSLLTRKVKELEKATDFDQMSEQDIREISELKTQIKKLETKPKRYIVNEASLEKLIKLLEENPNGLTLIRDELYGFLSQFSKKGFEGAREFFLESFNGNGSFSRDTLSRGTDTVDNLCISIIAGTQPDIIKKLLDHSVKHNDGFIQRFQMMSFPDPVDQDVFIDKAKDELAYQKVENLFIELDALDDEKEQIFKFCLEASKEYENFYNQLKQRNINDNLLESTLQKYDALVAKLSLIFQLVKDQESKEIDLESLQMALKWADYLESHTVRLYSLTKNKSSIKANIIERICNNSIYDKMTIRQLFQKNWKDIKQSEEFNQAIEELEDAHILRIEEKQNTNGGPKSKIIRVNPLVKEYF